MRLSVFWGRRERYETGFILSFSIWLFLLFWLTFLLRTHKKKKSLQFHFIALLLQVHSRNTHKMNMDLRKITNKMENAEREKNTKVTFDICFNSFTFGINIQILCLDKSSNRIINIFKINQSKLILWWMVLKLLIPSLDFLLLNICWQLFDSRDPIDSNRKFFFLPFEWNAIVVILSYLGDKRYEIYVQRCSTSVLSTYFYSIMPPMNNKCLNIVLFAYLN